MSGEGMVAVVHSLRDAGLAVTLLDGSRNRFSLVPNYVQDPPQQKYQTTLQRQNSAAGTDSTIRCDSSAQATDGRYVSVYQTAHGNLSPTSPPVHVTEFPPQRSELCPGHGNFEVGGLGSGEMSKCPIRPQHQGHFRGGLSWVDRGAVCAPRPSQPIDAFASSLRKYPPLSPGSSEMVERLITYSHSKNTSRNQSNGTSPVRSMESEVSHNTYTRRNGHGDLRSRSRVDEYPTREGRPRREESERRSYDRNYDVRFVRDFSRANDGGRNCSINSVHTETQAVVRMISKEVATVPKSEPVKKNVAVPNASSTSVAYVEGAVSNHPDPSQMDQIPSKIVSFKSVQTSSSSIELITTQKLVEARRSKSEDDVRRKHFQEGIIELIGNIAVNNKAKDEIKEKILKDMWVKLKRVIENVEQQKDREKALVNICKNMRKAPTLIPVRYEKESKQKIKQRAEIDVYRAAMPSYRISNTGGIEDIIKDWVNCLPIKSHDCIGTPINKLQICDSLVRKLLKLFTSNAKNDYEALKLQMLNVIGLVPLDIVGKRKKNIVDYAVDTLVFKLRNVAPSMFKSGDNISESKNKCDKLNRSISTIENKIKKCVVNDIVDFTETHNLEFNQIDVNEISAELTDITLDFIYERRVANENAFKEDIASFLKQYNVEIDKGMELANELFKHVTQRTTPPMKYGIKNFIVCLNTSMKRQRQTTANGKANTDSFRDDLFRQIDEWLTDIPIDIKNLDNKDTREAIVRELSEEIVDRKKYLEFNASQSSEEKELEYLKYQIYKWINKVADDENIEAIMEHASGLMDRIRIVSVPKLGIVQNILDVEVERTSKPAEAETACENVVVEDNNYLNNSKRRPSILKTKSQNGNGSKSPMSGCGGSKTQHITVEQMNHDYDEYVKNWIKEIPIPSTNPEESELAEKLRVGIYNGVWKALTKLKFDPGTFYNSFYYQDLLDNEIEELFNCLPKSAELDAKKHVLKAQLLEHTTKTHEKIKKLAEPAFIKQALVENVANIIPKIPNEDQDDPKKKYEDLQILGIVEDFIVIAHYEEENQVIANTFKNKLIKKTEAFVNELKKLHGKELKDIDITTYTQEIIDALSSVPLPGDDSLKEEAEEIMLGIEIEHWFNDLPLVSNDDFDEQLQRRRLRDKLTKKITDLQKRNTEECAAESAIKKEITKFLEKVPLKTGEDENVSFMVEELLNRIKNKKRERGNTRRRSVVFQDDIKYPSYHEFSKELPHCSSFANNQSNPPNYPSIHSSALCETEFHQAYNQNLNNSTLIGGGMSNNVLPINGSIYGGRGYKTFEQYRPLSSSMHLSRMPPGVNENVQLSQQLKSKWSTLEGTEPSQSPYNVHDTSDDQQVGSDATWYSLEEVEIPPEMRAQFQSSEPNLQSLKSMTYVDSLNPSDGSVPQTGQTNCCVENQDTSRIAQIIQDQISRINQIASGHTIDENRIANAYQNPEANRSSTNEIQTNQSLPTREDFQQNMNRFHEIPPKLETNRLVNQSDIPSTYTNVGTQPNRGYGSLGATSTQVPLVQTQRKVNRPIEISRNPRSTQYSISQQVATQNEQRSAPDIQYLPQHIPFQGIPKIPQFLQTHQNISFPSEIPIPRAMLSPQNIPYQQYLSPNQIPRQIIPETEPQQISQQVQTQPISHLEPGSITQQIQTQPNTSYGHPQGFSTPHQEECQRSPPRLGRKTHNPMRYRSGPARRRLDLDDDEESEEDCPCIARLKRRFKEDMDLCFYPFGYPFPYFF